MSPYRSSLQLLRRHLSRRSTPPCQEPQHSLHAKRFGTVPSKTGAPSSTSALNRWRSFSLVSVLLPCAGAAVFVAAAPTQGEREKRAKLLWSVPVRLARDIVTAAAIAADYKYSLYGLEPGPERETVLHQCHQRGAERLQALCFKNGGTYIKLGQHISQLDYLLPEEYVQTMRRSMLNKCPVSTFEQVSHVIELELGAPPSEVYAEFEQAPIASASLAQVHVARLHNGRKVAVKVQHGHLTDTAVADTATVAFIVAAVKWLFPHLDYQWLVDEVRESLPLELEFLSEAANSEKCRANFQQKSPQLATLIHIPAIEWKLSTARVLTMEFADGIEITDVEGIKKLGLRPADVAALVSQSFAEMIFRHGFVHCDPHAANMMVRRAPSSASRCWLGGGPKPQVVLLDHGLYRTLSDSLRLHYAGLWKSLVLADTAGIQVHGEALGARGEAHMLLAAVLTMRPWEQIAQKSIDHLAIPDTLEERRQLQGYAAQYALQVTALLAKLPRVLLLLLKTNDCLRSVDMALGTPVNTYVIVARECSRALAEVKTEASPGLLSRLQAEVEVLQVELRVLGLQILGWWLLWKQYIATHKLRTVLWPLGWGIWSQRQDHVISAA